MAEAPIQKGPRPALWRQASVSAGPLFAEPTRGAEEVYQIVIGGGRPTGPDRSSRSQPLWLQVLPPTGSTQSCWQSHLQ